jgi:hypothetical protein
MSSYIPSGANPEYPAVVPGHWIGSLSGVSGGGTLFAHTSFPFQDAFLDGVDLLDPNYDNGHNCNMAINSSLMSSGGVTFFQGFVYTSSQACFSWRGHVRLPSDATITCDAVIGSWQVMAWGTLLPQSGV